MNDEKKVICSGAKLNGCKNLKCRYNKPFLGVVGRGILCGQWPIGIGRVIEYFMEPYEGEEKGE